MSPVQTIEDFFARWSGASLRLPSGWFGRPHDNFHELTSIAYDGQALTIGLDGQQELWIDRPAVVAVDGRTLTMSAFAEARWVWVEYGGTERHIERFSEGAIEFAA